MTTNADTKKLFAEYQKLDDTVTKAKQTVIDGVIARSVAVKKIHEACGAGPFQFGGKTSTIVCRKGKDDDGNAIPGQETWFFKSIGESVTVIE
jgi:hypothetical protein